MLDRKAQIDSLDVGDIFHAEYPNGASCICLVLSVSDANIEARRITTQEVLEFDRQTGVEIDRNAKSLAVINSVAPLPKEIYGVFIAMDKKFGARMAMDEKARLGLDAEQRKLTDAEKSAIRFIDAYYPKHPLSTG